jgi:hypothetical protein
MIMSLVIYVAIMQIDLITSIMMLAGAGFFGYRGWQYLKLWWVTPSDEPVPCEFWRKHRKQSIVMGVILMLGMSLPSRTEAIAQYAGWRLANASLWDRVFADKASFEDAVGKLITQAGER